MPILVFGCYLFFLSRFDLLTICGISILKIRRN